MTATFSLYLVSRICTARGLSYDKRTAGIDFKVNVFEPRTTFYPKKLSD